MPSHLAQHLETLANDESLPVYAIQYDAFEPTRHFARGLWQMIRDNWHDFRFAARCNDVGAMIRAETDNILKLDVLRRFLLLEGFSQAEIDLEFAECRLKAMSKGDDNYDEWMAAQKVKWARLKAS